MNFSKRVHDLRTALRSLEVEHVLDTPVPAPNGEYSPLGDEEYQVGVVVLDRMSSELGDCYPHFRPFHLMEALMLGSLWKSARVDTN